jgi:TolA-binding protein
MSFFRSYFVLAVACMLVCLPTPSSAQDSRENADFKLAINLYDDGLYDLAAEQLRQFINAFPNTSQGIDARFYLGLTQLKLKKYDDARLTFQTFALTYQDNPKAPEAWWNVGESYAAIRDYKEAALAFERVKVFHPKSKLAADALLRASRYFAQAGERDNARRTLRIILQEYPASGAVLAARTQLGQMYFEDGNTEQAQNELKRVIEGDPLAEAKAQALLILGNIYQSLSKTDQAQATYEEIIAKHKNSSAVQGAYVNLAKLQASTGASSEAIENYRKALAEKTNVDSSLVLLALLGMGDTHASLKQYAPALNAYMRFLDTAPRDERVPEVLWKIAVTSSNAGHYGQSNDACARILKSGAPELLKHRALLKLGLNAEGQKQAQLAVQYFQSFVDQFPEDPAAPEVMMKTAGILEKQLRDPRKATTLYEGLASRYQRSPLADDALAGAARCQEDLRDFDAALEIYHELVEKYPASDLRQQAESRISMIGTFEQKEKDAGVEKLALLVGDVVAEKDKVGLSYRLGEIYFQDLKNYEAAAAQFTNAINSGMTGARFVDALYFRARSYEYLTRKDEKDRRPAIDSYQTFIQSFPSDPRVQDAALSLFQLRASDVASAKTAYTETLAAFPQFGRRDTLLLRLGELQENADSLQDALTSYTIITHEMAGSASAEEAGFRAVRIMAALGQKDSALAAGTAYVSTYPAGPHTAEVLSRIAEISAQERDATHAAELYRRLANEFFYTEAAADARRKLADALVAGGSFSEAVSVYADLLNQQETNALAENGADPSLLLALATAYQRAGDKANAKKYLFQVLAREHTGETAGQAYAALGWIYKDEGSVDIATSYFRQAEKISPGTTATKDVADLLFASGNYADAIKQFTELSRSAQDESSKRYFDSRIILAQFRDNKLAQADNGIGAFRKQYKASDEELAAFELERGSFYFRQKDYARALKTFTDVAKKYDDTPSAPDALYWIGKIDQVTGKAQEAIKQFTELMEKYPKADVVPRAHLALGNIYYDAENWPESIRHYRVIVDDTAADPSLLPYAMNNLIETYEAAGINDAALSVTRKYLELYPNSDDSFDKKIKIGILYSRLGYYDQAILHLQGLLDQAGSDLEGEIRYYIAEANYNKGDYQQAILDFLKVPYLVTKKGKIDWTANSLYMSGQSYEKMGRYDQAITMYQQIVERSGIDETFKAAAKKEIDRVKLVLKKKPG